MTKLIKTDNTEKILNAFVARMNEIIDPIKGFEGKSEVYMQAALHVQVEGEIARLGVELSKVKILQDIADSLKGGKK